MANAYRVGLVYMAGVVSGMMVTVIISVVYLRVPLQLVSPNATYHEIPMSHEDVYRIPEPNKSISITDEHFHKDNTSIADELYKKVRVLCWVMTQPQNLQTRAIHVRSTWGKRCNKVIFVSDKEDKDFPTIPVEIPHGREHLTAKTMHAFDYVYKTYVNEYDWFLKADDDTYVIVENLRYLLSSHKPEEPIYFGHHFKVIVNQGYFSGGGGYALSKEALKRFGNRGTRLCNSDYGAEDVEIGACMEKLGVKTGDSRDAQGRSRFHCFNPETHLRGGYPDWYLQYDKYGAKSGPQSISDYPITFHYVSVQQMYELEYFVYHMKPYGVTVMDQDLNRPADKATQKKSDIEKSRLEKIMNTIREKKKAWS